MIKIREFQAEDIKAILELFHSVVHTVGAKYYDSKQIEAWAPKDNQDHEKWMSSLMRNIAYVAEDNGKIVGFGDMSFSGYIDRLYVHKNLQGRGVALLIFRKLGEKALELGLKELTTEASIMVKPLAEKQGFEVIKKQTKIHRGVKFTNFLMRKKI